MAVVLLSGRDPEVALGSVAAARLGSLGVTRVAFVRDEQSVAVVLEGWAFEPSRSRDEVLISLGVPVGDIGGARMLEPLADMAVSTAAGSRRNE